MIQIISFQGLKESASNTDIGVKIMGDLDKQPFVAATKRIYSRKSGKRAADNKAAELCSLWEQYLRDPHWHPFKFISDEEGKTLVPI